MRTSQLSGTWKDFSVSTGPGRTRFIPIGSRLITCLGRNQISHHLRGLRSPRGRSLWPTVQAVIYWALRMRLLGFGNTLEEIPPQMLKDSLKRRTLQKKELVTSVLIPQKNHMRTTPAIQKRQTLRFLEAQSLIQAIWIPITTRKLKEQPVQRHLCRVPKVRTVLSQSSFDKDRGQKVEMEGETETKIWTNTEKARRTTIKTNISTKRGSQIKTHQNQEQKKSKSIILW